MINWSDEQYKAWQARKLTCTKKELEKFEAEFKADNSMPVLVPNKRSKYNAKKTTVDGITFDSKKEANRYTELVAMQTAGLIKNLRLQPKYLLQENFCKNGTAYRPIYYVADFEYFDTEKQKTIVEDVKSKATATPVYKLKKKLFEFRYEDLEVVEI